MTGPRPDVRPCTDASQAARVIAEAFTDLAVSRALVPAGAGERKARLEGYLQIHVDHAMVHGQVDVIDTRAVAVWFDLTRSLAIPADYGSRLAAACGRHAERFRRCDALLEKHHPSMPHHYLAFLAVVPAAQGLGLGSALLQHGHRSADELELPVYLEASSRESLGLYVGHGYNPAEEPFALDEGAWFWPCLRPPRTLLPR